MPRQPRPPVPAHLEGMIKSFDLSLNADRKSDRTREIYGDAARWFAGSLARLAQDHGTPDIDDWDEVTYLHLRQFFASLANVGYAKSYVNNIGRALQAYFKWYAVEEDVPNPFDGPVHVPPPPKLDEIPVPLIAVEHLAALLRDAEVGRDFASRRDAAVLRLFASAGVRLAELAGLQLPDVDLARREAAVTGKGNRKRTVRFDASAAKAIDRYLRVRAKHRDADLPDLWLGLRRAKGISARGLYRVVKRRGRRLGIDVHPHLFRHSFAHRWLDAGGAEGDLMELMGWDSAEMLRYYGRSARGARARRAYDRVDVMGGV